MASSSTSIFTGPGKVDSYTSTIYGLIRDQKYGEAIRLLTVELQNFPQSRAALSLLGYSYYALQDFRSAAQIYEELCRQNPEVESYRVYHAQCLYKAGLHPEASKACARVDSEQYAQRLLQLQAAIKYEEDDLAASRALLDKCVADDPETMVNQACVVYKEGQYEEARQLFVEALNAAPYNPATAYAVALCHYKLKQYGPALQLLNDIIERGVREHPELSVGSASLDGAQSTVARSVGNSATLRETALVEAFNLKAAISMQIGDFEKAREALADMPPRLEEELDPVTLHNIALTHIDVKESTSASGGAGDGGSGANNVFDSSGAAGSHGLSGAFSKLNFLLANPPFPSEAFANLLLLYVKHGFYDLAADVMAENAHLTVRYLTTDMYDFLDASLLAQTSPAEAYRRLDALTGVHVEALRRYTKAMQDSRLGGDADGVKRALKLYDEQLEKYIPVLLSMAKIYWDRGNHSQVEKILRQASEFASEHEAWQLAVGHCYFLQEGRSAECIRYYEPIVQNFMAGAGEMGSPASVFGSGGGMGSGGGATRTGGLLDVQPIVLANLCVAYVMTGQNESAEQIIHAIEREEERMKLQQAAERNARGGSSGGRNSAGVRPGEGGHAYFHSCIVNLAIGTLYCSKGRFDFGITRVLASLEDMPAKLGLDTWHYAKRALLALAESLSKGIVSVDSAARFSYPAREGKAEGLIPNVIKFLLAAEEHGKKIQVMFAAPAAAAATSQRGVDDRGFVQDAAAVAAAQAAAAAALEASKHTVSYEARLLRLLFLKLNED